MKKILITSGGTKEYIDGVRVLTNISTGKLSAVIADTFLEKIFYDNFDCEIHFVYVKGSELPKLNKFICGSKIRYYEVTDVKSVYNVMKKLVPEMNIVIHPMAVSDFSFKPINTKLKSNEPESFIQSLKDRIYQTPKILSKIKEWNPKCFLISFKFENGLSHDDLIDVAIESMNKNNCDVVIANDKAEMKNLKRHRAYFLQHCKDSDIIITGGIWDKSIESKEDIAIEIYNVINNL